MCLPFCCGNDDHESPPQGGTGMKTTHDPHGDGKIEPAIGSSTGNGKESSNGNGASENNKTEDFKNGGNTYSPPTLPPPTPPSPTPPPPQSPEGWAEQEHLSTPSWQDSKHTDKHKNPLPTPATKGPKIESPEHRGQISTVPTPATKGPKKPEHLAAGPHNQGPVSAPAPQPKHKATDTMRTPPSPQIARRGREGNYNPTAAPTVPVFEPAATNGLGDRGHDDDDHAYGGKDDQRKPGKIKALRLQTNVTTHSQLNCTNGGHLAINMEDPGNYARQVKTTLVCACYT